MNQKDIMYKFIKRVEHEKKLTMLIINIFDYQDFHDYNYISRIIKTPNEIIIDIYDNVSLNRFNRYIFNFSSSEYTIKEEEKNNVLNTYICIQNVKNSKNKLLKFAYIFKTSNKNSLTCAKTFLNPELVDILNKIITSS